MAVQYSQLLQQQTLMISSLIGCGAAAAAGNQTAALSPQMLFPTPPVFSEPVSELTCNISGSRKRSREEEPVMQPSTMASSTLLMYQQQLMLQKQYQQQLLLQNQIQLCNTHPDVVAVDNSRLNQSIMTSTSGRPSTAQYLPCSDSVFPANHAATNNTTASLMSLMNQQSLEIDHLILTHTDKLRSALDDSRKRQCRALVSAVAQHAQGRIAEKQAEVDAAEKRNADLQERLRKAAAESQAWFNVARNSEAVIASLRDSLEQALVQNLHGGGSEDNCGNKFVDSQLEEGYADSDEVVKAASGSAAASSAAGVPCHGRFTEVSKLAVASVEKKPSVASGIRFSPCKSCGASEGCVVVLPCRHLCLCPSCERSAVQCPVCRGRKNASLPINLSYLE